MGTFVIFLVWNVRQSSWLAFAQLYCLSYKVKMQEHMFIFSLFTKL